MTVICINLGAGQDPKIDTDDETWVNVDLLPLRGIDVQHNLMRFPYPFDDASAHKIHAVDVIEHLDHYTDDGRPTIVAFMEECWRILTPGGLLYIQAPGHDAAFMWDDPTHVRGFTSKSFDFFDSTTHYGQTTGFYSTADFRIIQREILDNKNLRFWMIKR